jgi:hypothetical protein
LVGFTGSKARSGPQPFQSGPRPERSGGSAAPVSYRTSTAGRRLRYSLSCGELHRSYEARRLAGRRCVSYIRQRRPALRPARQNYPNWPTSSRFISLSNQRTRHGRLGASYPFR